MNLRMYAIYDRKAEAFMTPFFTHTKGLAMRMFMDACADKNSPLCKYPMDFALFWLGNVDDNSGVVENIENVPLMTASDCLREGSVDNNNGSE